MSLASAPSVYPPHARVHHHHAHHHSSHSYLHPLENSPPLAHEPLTPSSPLEPHTYYSSSSVPYLPPPPPYHAPSPPYSHPPHRSDSADLNQKPSLPYPRGTLPPPQHSHAYPPVAPAPLRGHPSSYSPPALPPLVHAPPSPRSPDSPPFPSSHRNSSSSVSSHGSAHANSGLDDLHYFRSESLSPSPPPSSIVPGATSANHLSAPLSVNDRRERNKAASAKYRAKKHHQSGEMRSQISYLQDQNSVMSRQLDETRTENATLKAQVEKLKSRLVAEKVLKRLREVGRERRGGHESASLTGGRSSGLRVTARDLASDSEEDVVDSEAEDEHGDDIGNIARDDERAVKRSRRRQRRNSLSDDDD